MRDVLVVAVFLACAVEGGGGIDHRSRGRADFIVGEDWGVAAGVVAAAADDLGDVRLRPPGQRDDPSLTDPDPSCADTGQGGSSLFP